jgi:shikimate dehydrogenase
VAYFADPTPLRKEARPVAPEIGPRTQLCAVILHPAGHTRSPAMHNAAFRALGLDAIYVAFDVTPAGLSDALAGARALGIRQLAVSLPHKQAVIPLLDEVDDTARRIGAVNTVTRQEDRLVGANTDWIGAVRALERATPLAGRNVVVLGAGGTARAVVFGALERRARVAVLNRSASRAEALAKALGAHGAGALSDLSGLPCDVLVNATSVGLRSPDSPVPAEAIPPRAVVMDVVYDPPRTRLLQDASARGARVVEGRWMLVYQAAEQLRIWSGREAPVEVMAEAFDRAGA